MILTKSRFCIYLHGPIQICPYPHPPQSTRLHVSPTRESARRAHGGHPQGARTPLTILALLSYGAPCNHHLHRNNYIGTLQHRRLVLQDMYDYKGKEGKKEGRKMAGEHGEVKKGRWNRQTPTYLSHRKEQTYQYIPYMMHTRAGFEGFPYPFKV